MSYSDIRVDVLDCGDMSPGPAVGGRERDVDGADGYA